MTLRQRRALSPRRILGRLWLRAFGWTLDERLPGVDRAVLVAAPHTSNWDLPFALAVAWSLGLRMRWVGKHTLFRPPFGGLMRRLGGISLDRAAARDTVEALAGLFEGRPELMLLIAPSGTRSRAARWRTGFYYVALRARVPIVLGYLDYGRRRGGLGELLVPSGDLEKDFEAIRAFYAPVRGRYPEQETEISPGEPAGAPPPTREGGRP